MSGRNIIFILLAVFGFVGFSQAKIIGYDTNNNFEPVEVEEGKYYPGVSLYPPLGALRVFTIPQGGTGTSTVPSNGQMLISDGTKYIFTASSSLGVLPANAIFTSLTSTNSFATNSIFTNATSTNLNVSGSLNLPLNSVTDAMVVDALTVSGGTVNNSPIGATVASTGVFTSVTSTNFFTGLLQFTNLLGTNATTTNLSVSGLTNLANTTITSVTSTNARATTLNWGGATGGTLTVSSMDTTEILVTADSFPSLVISNQYLAAGTGGLYSNNANEILTDYNPSTGIFRYGGLLRMDRSAQSSTFIGRTNVNNLFSNNATSTNLAVTGLTNLAGTTITNVTSTNLYASNLLSFASASGTQATAESFRVLGTGINGHLLFSNSYYGNDIGGIYNTNSDEIIADYALGTGIYRYGNGLLTFDGPDASATLNTLHTSFTGSLSVNTSTKTLAQVLIQASSTNATNFQVLNSLGKNILTVASGTVFAFLGGPPTPPAAIGGIAVATVGADDTIGALNIRGGGAVILSNSDGTTRGQLSSQTLFVSEGVNTSTYGHDQIIFNTSPTALDGKFRVDGQGNVFASGTLRVYGATSGTEQLAMGSWQNATAQASIDWTSGVDTAPDFATFNNTLVLSYDATVGSVDTDYATFNFGVPDNYKGDGRFRCRVSQGSATITNIESIVVRVSIGNSGTGDNATTTLQNTTNGQEVYIAPTASQAYAPGRDVGVLIKQGNSNADDAVNFQNCVFVYTKDN